jgi:hypothetical protein
MSSWIGGLAYPRHVFSAEYNISTIIVNVKTDTAKCQGKHELAFVGVLDSFAPA